MAKDMLGVLIRKIVDLSLGTLNVIYDLVEKLSGEAGQEWFAELKKFLRKENCWTGVINKFLKLISGDEILSLDAVDGTETLANAKDVFNYIDSDLKNWGVDEEGPSTEKTIVDVYEMVKDATFSQMFGELNVDMRKLCLTQHQIKKFVEKHRKWLRTDGYGTFFLFESKGNFFVASAGVTSDGRLRVDVYRFESSRVWRAEGRRRVVVSQLA